MGGVHFKLDMESVCGEGGVVHFKPCMKSGRGVGCPLQARYENWGGGGGGVGREFIHIRLNMKSGRRGVVHFRLDMKSSIWKACVGGGVCPLQAPYEKWGGGGGGGGLSTSGSIWKVCGGRGLSTSSSI